MQPSLIVGFGRAGRDLHLKCLLKAHQRMNPSSTKRPSIGIIDPKLVENLPELPCNIELFSSYNSAMKALGSEATVHVCTPPSCHADAIEDAINNGFQNIIVEKPLANTPGELRRIGSFLEGRDCKVVVVANWLASTLTKRLIERMERMTKCEWQSIKITQHKARFGQTLENNGHQSAFDVEIPHEVALALYVAGLDAEVTDASCEDMCINGKRIPHMGSASMTLQHASGQISRLCSNLMSPVRQRTIEICLDNGWRLEGYFPTDSSDSYSQLHVVDQKGDIVERAVFPDDPLSSCFIEAYQFFDGSVAQPISDYQFNENVVSLIQKAKEICGIDTEDQST